MAGSTSMLRSRVAQAARSGSSSSYLCESYSLRVLPAVLSASSRRTLTTASRQNNSRPPATHGKKQSATANAPLRMLGLRPTLRFQAQQASAPSAASPPSASSATGTQSADSSFTSTAKVKDLSGGFSDGPLLLDEGSRQVDWARSFHGLSAEPFSKDTADVLLQPLSADDVELKPDGIVYLPEIKYRRILNKAFGPGGWGMAPRGETIVTGKSVTREYALVAHGRLVSIARGEQDYFSPEGISTAVEGCKSNALMRCCKDLGVASELWDPQYIRKFLAQHAREVFAEHVPTKKKRKLWIRKGEEVRYPFKETKGF